MAIPNPIGGSGKGPIGAVSKTVKKIPPKVAIVAVGGGVLIYVVMRSHKSNTDPAAATADTTAADASSAASSPYPGTLPGVYPIGSGQGAAPLPAVDFSGDSVGIEGVPAVSDTAVGDGGSLGTLNIVVGTAADGASGSDVTPGPKAASNGAKTVKSKTIKTLADLPLADRNAIHAERKAGKVDKFGRTPTERKAARANTGISAQLRTRLNRQRAAKAGGGPPSRQHPSAAHGAPKRPIKQSSPQSHGNTVTESRPVNQPNPPRTRKRSNHRRK